VERLLVAQINNFTDVYQSAGDGEGGEKKDVKQCAMTVGEKDVRCFRALDCPRQQGKSVIKRESVLREKNDRNSLRGLEVWSSMTFQEGVRIFRMGEKRGGTRSRNLRGETRGRGKRNG